MPYFFILPAFVAYFITMVVAINVAVLCRPAGHLRRYLASFLIWSSLGFVASTVVYAIMLVVSAKVWGQITAGKSSIAGGVVMGVIVFIAPFVAAAAGLIGGGIFGLWKCLSKCKPLA
jgi:hypothetical protein